MIKLKDGSEVTEDVFYSWGGSKQRLKLIGQPDGFGERLAQKLRGRKDTDETKARKSVAAKERDNSNWGAETRVLAMSEVQCPHCPNVGKRMIMLRWHFDNCEVVKGPRVLKARPALTDDQRAIRNERKRAARERAKLEAPKTEPPTEFTANAPW